MAFWSPLEVRMLFQAVAHAPSVHNTQPWVLETHERSVLLFERWDIALPHHDPDGRDRLMSCGAALTNLELVIHNLGWQTSTTLFPDTTQPDLVAVVTARQRALPSDNDRLWYAAIPHRRSHRLRFAPEPLSAEEFRVVRAALLGERVSSRTITGRTEAGAVASTVEHAAKLLRHDRAYLRELRSWTIRRRNGARAGIPEDHFGHALFGGFVHPHDGIPEHAALTTRIDEECVLVVETVDDSKRDQVLAGAAIQRAWLAATSLGLAASVVTQPLRLPEGRDGLTERLCLAGFPQALLRIGHTYRVPAAVPRRSLAEVVRTPSGG